MQSPELPTRLQGKWAIDYALILSLQSDTFLFIRLQHHNYAPHNYSVVNTHRSSYRDHKYLFFINEE
jgi:hypothetical protein